MNPLPVVVGGGGRKAGKTELVCAIVRALPQMHWTAVKVSHPHSGAGWSMAEEFNGSGRADTSRYLLAGAARAYWVQAAAGDLPAAAGAIREAIRGRNAIIESNAIVDFLDPGLYLMVLGGEGEPKESARRRMDRVDAFVRWDAAGGEWLGKPLFGAARGAPLPAPLLRWIVQFAGRNATDTDRRPSDSQE